MQLDFKLKRTCLHFQKSRGNVELYDTCQKCIYTQHAPPYFGANGSSIFPSLLLGSCILVQNIRESLSKHICHLNALCNDARIHGRKCRKDSNPRQWVDSCRTGYTRLQDISLQASLPLSRLLHNQKLQKVRK